MRGKKANTKVILIDGVHYYASRPKNCKDCFFWKNRKVGCILGESNCYYLAETIKSKKEKECEGCCYAKGQPCVSACCYKKLDRWLHTKRAMEIKKKEGNADE